MTSRKMGDLPRVEALVIDADTVRFGGDEFRRVKRCRDMGGEEGMNYEMYDFGCSECGFAADVTDVSFCSNCGAKVVEE